MLRTLLGALLIFQIAASAKAVELISPRELVRLTFVTGEIESLAPRADLCYGSPRYSPDGARITFDAWSVDKSFSESSVYVINRDGTGLKQYHSGALPSWAPDGNSLLLRTHGRVGNNSNVLVMNLDGSGVESLPIVGNGAKWSPNGRQIAYLSRNSNDSEIYGQLALYDAATGLSQRITGARWSPSWSGHWSPAGKQYAFINRDNAALPNQVAVATLTGDFPVSEIRVLAEGAEIATNVTWSPDGQSIAFSMRPTPHAKYQIYTVGLDEDDAPQRMPGQAEDVHNLGVTFSPDGNDIVYVREPKFADE